MMFFKILFKLFPRRRWGSFWCKYHWNYLQQNKDIDKDVAALGVIIALQEGKLARGPRSCERIPSELLMGIFERSKGWE